MRVTDSASENVPSVAGLGEVDQRVEQRGRVDAVVALGGHVGQQHGGEAAAEAEAGHVDLLGAGDVVDDVEGGAGPVEQVVVEADVAHGGVGVAVADLEDGVAVLHGPLHEAPARGQIHDVVLVDPRRADSSGISYVVLVCGSYWISSIRSLRNTTLPGVAAMFLPTVNADRSTLRGSPPLVVRSVMKFRTPRMRLTPPVSNARLRAAGLVARKLVGARASTRPRRANGRLPVPGLLELGQGEQVVDEAAHQAVGLAGGEESGVLLPGLVGEALVLARRGERAGGLEPDGPAGGGQPGQAEPGARSGPRRRWSAAAGGRPRRRSGPGPC